LELDLYVTLRRTLFFVFSHQQDGVGSPQLKSTIARFRKALFLVSISQGPTLVLSSRHLREYVRFVADAGVVLEVLALLLSLRNLMSLQPLLPLVFGALLFCTTFV
jgi:hypothetical protein